MAAGLTADGVRWAFTTLPVANWHPLTWLSHMLDVQLFGLRPGAHHLVNAGIHAANARRSSSSCSRASPAPSGSASSSPRSSRSIPLHVESVAWVSERKDLLSHLLRPSSPSAPTRATPPVRRSPGTAIVLLLLAASLLAKAMWITAPFLLLLLDFWPLQRVAAPWNPSDPRPPAVATPPGRAARPREAAAARALRSGRARWRWSPRRGEGALEPARAAALVDRIANAARATSYLRPDRLASERSPPSTRCARPARPGSGASAPLLLAGASPPAPVAPRGACPGSSVGWLWYLGMLVPVIGLVQVGSQAMADRYTYVPLVGIFVALLWTVDALVRRRRTARDGRRRRRGVALAGLAIATWIQIGHWRDQVSLFSHAWR